MESELNVTVKTVGGSFNAFRVLPSATPAPVVVVLQEIFGINADMRETCRWLASSGFVALCPDLFWRAEPGLSLSHWTEAEWKKGLALYAAYDRDLGVADIAYTLEVGRNMSESSGRVGLVGYSLGGLMTFLTTTREGTDASVAYYGGETEKYLAESGDITNPLLMHLGEEDEFITSVAREQIVDAVSSNPYVQVFTYPGCRHAFARKGGTHYDPAAASLANARTIDFLKAYLA